MIRYLIIFIVPCIVSCKSIKSKEECQSVVLLNQDTLNLYTLTPILWRGQQTAVYYKITGENEWGETTLTIYTNNKSAAQVVSDDNVSISKPYFIDNNRETFFIIFKTWLGSGNLSEKFFFT